MRVEAQTLPTHSEPDGLCGAVWGRTLGLEANRTITPTGSEAMIGFFYYNGKMIFRSRHFMVDLAQA